MSDLEIQPAWWTSDDWATPPDVFARISAIYGPFDLDACCRTETAKVEAFYTKEHDGLTAPWHGRVWVNPPYSDPGTWLRKAIAEVTEGRATRVVLLLPAATDTGWYHDLVIPHADVVPVRGRVRFLGWRGVPVGSPKGGSVIAIMPKRPAETFDARPAKAPRAQAQLFER